MNIHAIMLTCIWISNFNSKNDHSMQFLANLFQLGVIELTHWVSFNIIHTYVAYHILIPQTNCMLLTCFLHFSRKHQTSAQSRGRFSRTDQTFLGELGSATVRPASTASEPDGRGKIFLFFSFFSHFLIEFLKFFGKSWFFWKFIFCHFFQNSFTKTF